MRRLRQLLRKRGLRAAERVVVVEGAELLSVALAAGASGRGRLRGPRGGAPTRRWSRSRTGSLGAGGRVFDLAPGVMERVASTVTPQPVLAVVRYEPATVEPARRRDLVVVCVDVRDPGNLGTRDPDRGRRRGRRRGVL